MKGSQFKKNDSQKTKDKPKHKQLKILIFQSRKKMVKSRKKERKKERKAYLGERQKKYLEERKKDI